MGRSLRGDRSAGGAQPSGSGSAGTGSRRGFDLENRAAELTFAELCDDTWQKFCALKRHGLRGCTQDTLQGASNRSVGHRDKVRQGGGFARGHALSELAPQDGLGGIGETFEARLHLLE